MISIKPNSKDPIFLEKPAIRIFLAGSIEMGRAENWQHTVEQALKKYNGVLYNPRRDDWDASWEQNQKNIQFNKQVNWELNHLQVSDIVFMYLAPDTKSPISLLELGKYAGVKQMIVCCPKEFWRHGNVEILCVRENVPLYSNLDDAIGALCTKIEFLSDSIC